MIERKIYPRFAFTEDEQEKARCNREIYAELNSKYKIYRRDTKMTLVDGEDCDFSQFDVVIGRSAGYNHALYKVYKNAPNLSQEELALVCDCGNLCFGYTMQGELFYVFED